MKISVVVTEFFNKNRIFDPKISGSSFYETLRDELSIYNIEIATSDYIKEDIADLVIYENYSKANRKDAFFIATESKVVIPKFHSKFFLSSFSKVFTWNDNLVDNKNIFKIFLSYDFFLPVNLIHFSKRKLITNISSNKYSSHKDELYSKRIEVIKFFDEFQSSQFDFYGAHWDKQFTYPNLYNYVKKISLIKGFGFFMKISFKIINVLKLNKFFFENYNCYKGLADDKLEVLRKYKFNICFENATNVECYITEKIFDSFKSGCVPIYLGSSNIDSLIPKNTFIDFRDFKTLNELNTYLVGMDEEIFNKYLFNASKFIQSDAINIFKHKPNVEVLTHHILNKINSKPKTLNAINDKAKLDNQLFQ